MRIAPRLDALPLLFRPRWRGLMVALLLLLFSVAHADVPLPSGAPAANPTQPIAVQNILAYAAEEQRQIDQVRQLLARPRQFDGLTAELDGIADAVNAKLHGTASGSLAELPVMRLESLARHWEFDRRRMEHWEAKAAHAFHPYEEQVLRLAQRRAAWSATRAAGLLDGLPPAMQDRVDSMLSDISDCEVALGTVLSRQLAMMQRASNLKANIARGENEVTAAIDDIDRRLLRIDIPPIWESLAHPGNPQASLAAMRRGMQIEMDFARSYHAADNANQQALRVVQLLLIPLVAAVAWRVRHLRGGAGTFSHNGLRRPVSLWLLLAMLAVFVLEPDAPLLAHEMALLILLVPALRLMPQALARALGAWPYLAAALYFLDRVGVTAIADIHIYRWYLLVLNALALGLTAWTLRRPLPVVASPQLARAKTPLAWAALLALIVAAACNIAGNVSLAGALTSGVVDSGYMALVLYAGATACLALIDLFISQWRQAKGRFIERQGPVLQALCGRLLVLAACLGWLLYSLARFRLLRPLQTAGAQILALGIEIGEVSLHVGDVLIFLFSAWLAVWAARAVRRLSREELHGATRLPRGAGNSIASLSYYGVLLLGLLLALSAAGFRVSQLMLVFGALGVGVGFGLQNVVNNFVSGLVLMFERPIQPGDVVDAAGISGTVHDIRLRSTTIRTFDGADAIVPNGTLLSGNLTNWTMFDRSRRIEITVAVAYDAAVDTVVSVIQAAALGTHGVAAEPAPIVQLSEYGDSALKFSVRVWTGDVAHWMQVRADLLGAVLRALGEAGIAIPYPQLTVGRAGSRQPK